MGILIKILAVLVFTGSITLSASSAKVLNMEVQETIQKSNKRFKGAKDFLSRTEGYLVFPNVYKAGFVIGGEYGEGGMVIKGKIAEYYKMLSASFGFQAGAQRKAIIIAFLTSNALESFRKSDKWKAGVDGSIAFVDWGGGIDLSTIDLKKSIVAIAFDQRGLMGSLSLEGAVFTKFKK
jgi:lipid-binding SYLF domain-containing protein